MKIFITCPNAKVPHGGLRIIFEWANRLTQWHDVYLHFLSGNSPGWFPLDDKVNVVSIDVMAGCDCVILTSPHSALLLDKILPHQKGFVFLQMREDQFNPTDQAWQELCRKLYTTHYPVISISLWNIHSLQSDYNRTGITDYVSNGINFEHFPIKHTPKSGNTVLVEGWECTNLAKDTDRIGPKVAQRLKAEGYYIAAYGGVQLKTFTDIPNEYYYRPDLVQINDLYERATILIKASRYDARSCSPVEAMTKGTVTARAVIDGDDDLLNGFNCVRVGYDVEQLYKAAKRLLNNQTEREMLAANAIEYVRESCDWNQIMKTINEIICQ